MSGERRVLIFPGGTEIGLEIGRALGWCKEARVYSAGVDAPSHAPYVFSRHFIVPSVHAAGWLDRLNEVVDRERIDYVFPAHDDVIVALASNATSIHARVVTSPLETCLIARSKKATYRRLDKVVPVPRYYGSVTEIDEFPVFAKPDRGQGSSDTHLIRSGEELGLLSAPADSYVYSEYLPGDEFTVDCFSDRERGLLFCAGRQRLRVRNGIAVNSRLVQNPVFEEMARAISGALPLHGTWFFQVKADRSGTLRLLEFAPRIAGTMALNRVLGVNFPLLSLFELERMPIQIRVNAGFDVEIDRALVNRYKHSLAYDAVYVDLDDTLVVRGAVNPQLARFLFQCLNAGKQLYLVTRHAGDLDAVLEKHRLKGLFDGVYHLKASESKATAISVANSIFIDDSFRERREVAEACGINVFDSSMLEMLVDERD